MPEAIISYDKDLPEIPDREPHLPPTAYLRKKKDKKDEFEVVAGRRPSKLLLVKNLREAVEKWRKEDYPGASSVSKRLFTFWFDEDHLVGGSPFRYYFGQREAVETLVYLYEIAKNQDSKKLIDDFGEIFYHEGAQLLLGTGITHQTTMDGKRQIRRYIPEVEGETIQDLPSENLRRYAFKMATGSGKTVVMAMVMVWSYFHRKMVKGSDLSANFLLLAPNVIVYQRLEKDFASNRIFHDLPLIPLEWNWNLKVILRGQSVEPDTFGNLFLTNIQQIYESRQTEWTPASAVDALLGRKPSRTWLPRNVPCWNVCKVSMILWSSTMKPTTCTMKSLNGTRRLSGFTRPCLQALPCGLIFPQPQRTRTAPISLGSFATIRLLRQLRTVLSRPR